MIRIGDIRNELGLDLRKALEKVISRMEGRREPYFILVYAMLEEPNIIRTKVMILDNEPPRMLGTICYRADNKKGQLIRLWVLPLDIDRPPELIDEEAIVKEVLEHSQIVGKFIH